MTPPRTPCAALPRQNGLSGTMTPERPFDAADGRRARRGLSVERTSADQPAMRASETASDRGLYLTGVSAHSRLGGNTDPDRRAPRADLRRRPQRPPPAPRIGQRSRVRRVRSASARVGLLPVRGRRRDRRHQRRRASRDLRDRPRRLRADVPHPPPPTRRRASPPPPRPRPPRRVPPATQAAGAADTGETVVSAQHRRPGPVRPRPRRPHPMTTRAHVTVRGERHDLGEYANRATAREAQRRARVRLGLGRTADRWGRVSLTRAEVIALNARLAEITGRPHRPKGTS